ncbi:hypothetical protein Aperf_G00000083802 [Anoplocephala perfoliata]
MELKDHKMSIEKWMAQLPLMNENTAECRNGNAFDVHSSRALRITAVICDLVYDTCNFIVVSWAIRIPSRSKSICSNFIGFSGGMTRAILTPHLCQIYTIGIGHFHLVLLQSLQLLTMVKEC